MNYQFLKRTKERLARLTDETVMVDRVLLIELLEEVMRIRRKNAAAHTRSLSHKKPKEKDDGG